MFWLLGTGLIWPLLQQLSHSLLAVVLRVIKDPLYALLLLDCAAIEVLNA